VKWRIYQLLLQIEQRLIRTEHNMATAQESIDALTAQVTAQGDQFVALAAALAGIQEDIRLLVEGQVPGEPVDLTGLQAAVGELVTAPGVQVQLATAIAERDRARDAAVSLEQECARLAAEVNRLRRVRASLRTRMVQLRDTPAATASRDRRESRLMDHRWLWLQTAVQRLYYSGLDADHTPCGLTLVTGDPDGGAMAYMVAVDYDNVMQMAIPDTDALMDAAMSGLADATPPEAPEDIR